MQVAKRSVTGVLIISLVLGLLTATTTLAAPSGGIGGRPANPDPNNPRTSSIFINTANRGEEVVDTVLVANGSDKERIVELYAVDGVVTNTGAYTCRQKAEPLLGSGKWIKLDKNETTLKPGTDEEINFTITIPSNADVGEHNACLVFADKDSEGEAQGGVRIRTRQAVRVVTTIPGNLHREIKLDSFKTTSNSESQQFAVSVSNKGNVSADVNIQAVLTSVFGNEAFRTGGVYPVLSNEKLDLNFTNEKPPFWGGWYKSSVTVEYNKDPKQLGFNEKKELAAVQGMEETIFIMPTTNALIIIGASILALLMLIIATAIRRARSRGRKKKWQDYIVQQGDTVEDLAKKSGVKWKLLAKTNNLVAPYTLVEGRTIKLPLTANKRGSTATPASSSKVEASQEQGDGDIAAKQSATKKGSSADGSSEIKKPGWKNNSR